MGLDEAIFLCGSSSSSSDQKVDCSTHLL